MVTVVEEVDIDDVGGASSGVRMVGSMYHARRTHADRRTYGFGVRHTSHNVMYTAEAWVSATVNTCINKFVSAERVVSRGVGMQGTKTREAHLVFWMNDELSEGRGRRTTNDDDGGGDRSSQGAHHGRRHAWSISVITEELAMTLGFV